MPGAYWVDDDVLVDQLESGFLHDAGRVVWEHPQVALTVTQVTHHPHKVPIIPKRGVAVE